MNASKFNKGLKGFDIILGHYGSTPELVDACRAWERAVIQRDVRNAFHLAVAGALSLAMTTPASALVAADGIQQIRLGLHVFYLPKDWMQGVRAPRAQGMVLAQNPPHPPVNQAQSGPIDATKIDIWPGLAWQPYGATSLPKIIEINYGAAGKSPRGEDEKRWLEKAESQTSDRAGFVRVEAGFAKPGEVPHSETFLYKGYLNQFGEPLIVNSNNIESPNSGRYLSSVTIQLQHDIGLTYRFDNKTFPENAWWQLYQRTLVFLDFLQKPK